MMLDMLVMIMIMTIADGVCTTMLMTRTKELHSQSQLVLASAKPINTPYAT